MNSDDTPKRAVLFDFGNVARPYELTQFYNVLLETCRAFDPIPYLASLGAQRFFKELEKDELWVKFMTGANGHCPSGFFSKFCDRFHIPKELTFAQFADLWVDVFIDPPHGGCLSAVVEKLRKKGVPVGLITNTDPWVWEKIIKNHPIFDLIDPQYRIASHLVACAKPSIQMWKTAANTMGFPIQEMILVDDCPHNCAAFEQEGGTAISFNAHHQPYTWLEGVLNELGLIS